MGLTQKSIMSAKESVTGTTLFQYCNQDNVEHTVKIKIYMVFNQCTNYCFICYAMFGRSWLH